MIGSEVERQFYLGTAGIRMWYARQPLPGAAPSPEFDFSVEAEAPETNPRVLEPALGPVKDPERPAAGPDRTEGVARIAGLQALMEGDAGASANAARPSTELSVMPQPVAEKAVPEPQVMTAPFSAFPSESINIMVWAGSSAALIGSMSSDASSLLQETLAVNILKSLGENQPKVLGHLSWPIFNNLLVPGNSGQDFVEVMASVVSGLKRHDVVVLQDLQNSEQSWLSEALGRDPARQFPHTLAEIAGNPNLKRLLWERIRPLVAR